MQVAEQERTLFSSFMALNSSTKSKILSSFNQLQRSKVASGASTRARKVINRRTHDISKSANLFKCISKSSAQENRVLQILERQRRHNRSSRWRHHARVLPTQSITDVEATRCHTRACCMYRCDRVGYMLNKSDILKSLDCPISSKEASAPADTASWDRFQIMYLSA